jgi:hypothetical protein
VKKRILVIGAIVLVIGLLVTASLHDAGVVQDVALLRDVKPFAHGIELPGGVPGLVRRHYSLNMPYDEVVTALETELAPLGWTHTDTYWESRFSQKGRLDLDSILVRRGRLVTGLRQPSGNRGTLTGSIKKLTRETGSNLPDSHDWVSVISTRRVGSVDTFLLKVRKLLKKKKDNASAPFTRYEILSPMPMRGSTKDLVDVKTGTRALESATDAMIYYTGAVNY